LAVSDRTMSDHNKFVKYNLWSLFQSIPFYQLPPNSFGTLQDFDSYILTESIRVVGILDDSKYWKTHAVQSQQLHQEQQSIATQLSNYMVSFATNKKKRCPTPTNLYDGKLTVKKNSWSDTFQIRVFILLMNYEGIYFNKSPEKTLK
jgi:hypothetical protein